MPTTLEKFASDCHEILAADSGRDGRAKVRDLLKSVLRDDEFVATHLGPENRSERKLLYHDEQLEFCIFAHVYEGAKKSRPHDHGRSWAIYGQASGATEMTDWQIVEPAVEGSTAGAVKAARKYVLERGDAYLYNERDVHSPLREGDTRLIRIEGINMDGVPRCWYDEV